MAGPVVICWFRRDLRVTDHPALEAAVAHAGHGGGRVLALFVHDPGLSGPSGPNRLAYLYACLRSLQADGVPLHLAEGNPADVVQELAARHGADAVYATADFAPYGMRRDAGVAAVLAAEGRRLELIGSPYIVAPGTVLKGDGTPFKVFTPFSRQWAGPAAGEQPGPRTDPAAVAWVPVARAAAKVPKAPHGAASGLPEAGERAAADRIARFVQDHLHTYDEERNVPGVDGTSRLSPDLKYGVVHPRQLLPAIAAHPGKGSRVFLSELCWREFYADVMFHRPDSARTELNQQMAHMRHDTGRAADERFRAWCEGRTGYPFIDAGMRQLLAEGWMHNRVRMAVASFLVKDLHLDWRRGARWFMEHLVDGDLASNQHGWQWTAGTGTDAAPYSPFNPVSQGRKFDPDGAYVRRYVPELSGVDDRWVHEPWADPARRSRPAPGTATLFDPDPAAPAVAGASYPDPIVDHAAEREEALARYADARGDARGDARSG